jgi:hypothetical protein
MLVCDFCVHRNDDETYTCHDCYKWSNFVQDFSVPAQKENVAAQAYKNCAVNFKRVGTWGPEIWRP